MPESSFSADAITEVSSSGSLTADAVVVMPYFTADAWIIGERQRHHRIRDHFGMESDLYVALSEDIGPYIAFTPVHWVLSDMVARIESLENNNRRRANFTADAFVAANGTYGYGYFFADAVQGDVGTGSFTADATFTHGGTFTADAFFAGSIIARAYIVGTS